MLVKQLSHRKRLQSTVLSEKKPTQTTDPTLQCVVDIGRPDLLATSTVNAAPSSMVNPLFKQNFLTLMVVNFVKP